MTVGVGLYSQTAESKLGAVSVGLFDEAFLAMSYLRSAQYEVVVAAKLPEAQAAGHLHDALDNIVVAKSRALSPAGAAAAAGLHKALGELVHLQGDALAEAMARTEDDFDTSVEIYAADAYHLRRVAGDVLRETSRRTWVALAISMVAALVITILLSRAILPQLGQAVGVAQAIAGGNLANDIRPRGRSEVAALLRALSTMQAAISVTLAENRALLEQQAATHAVADRHQAQIDAFVQRFGRSIAGVFQIVSDSSEGMMQRAECLRTDADALMCGERDISQELEQVVARISEASLSSKALSEAILGIREQAAQTEHRAKVALEETQAASVQMQTLDHVADEIAVVASLIGSVASETKMLALNATIEAARAGSAGAGFAVVAHEVRLLAQRSAQEAKMVQERVASIVATAAAARASITAIDTSARDVYRLSASIARAVASQEQASNDMWCSVWDISVNASNVERSVSQIGSTLREGANHLRAIGTEAGRLAQNGSNLSGEVSAFLQYVGSIKVGEFTRQAPVTASAEFEVAGTVRSGRVTFTSDVAATFSPGFEATVGIAGTLWLGGSEHAVAVRIAGGDAGALHLQPPLAEGSRRQLRALLGEVGRTPQRAAA